MHLEKPKRLILRQRVAIHSKINASEKPKQLIIRKGKKANSLISYKICCMGELHDNITLNSQ